MTNLSKSQIPGYANGAIALHHVVAGHNDVAAVRQMTQSGRMPRYQCTALDHLGCCD